MMGPQLDILYCASGFTIPTPESIAAVQETGTIFIGGGVRIVRISPDIVVKFGSHVSFVEAKSMLFVIEQAASIPVPHVYAYYSYGPFGRDLDDFGSDFDHYIVMQYIEGETAEQAWPSLSQVQKANITSQLSTYMTILRSITPTRRGCIGSVDGGPITDVILENYHARGPFDSEQDFNDTLIDAYLTGRKLPHMKHYLDKLLSQHQHRVVFTHGDLRPANIMIQNGEISGIIDWEMSGWYPEYWEFSKALYIWRWSNDWGNSLLQALEPYYLEHLVHRLFTTILW